MPAHCSRLPHRAQTTDHLPTGNGLGASGGLNNIKIEMIHGPRKPLGYGVVAFLGGAIIGVEQTRRIELKL